MLAKVTECVLPLVHVHVASSFFVCVRLDVIAGSICTPPSFLHWVKVPTLAISDINRSAELLSILYCDKDSLFSVHYNTTVVVVPAHCSELH